MQFPCACVRLRKLPGNHAVPKRWVSVQMKNAFLDLLVLASYSPGNNLVFRPLTSRAL